MPETSLIHNPETPLLPNLSKALLVAGGLGFASILTTLAFNESGYWDIHDRDMRCRITGKGTSLQAAHIYHDGGVLGGYNSPENGVFLSDIAHGFQHYMIYRLGVEGQCGLRTGESLASSISCIGARKKDYRVKRTERLHFPIDETILSREHRLDITLLIASWLLGLKGVLLNEDKKPYAEFCYGYYRIPNKNKYKVPKRGKNIPKNGPPASAIIKYRNLTMGGRLAEVERVRSRLNGAGEYIFDRFIDDPSSGFNPQDRPDVNDLVSIYRAYRG